jgi:hypothetical protein
MRLLMCNLCQGTENLPLRRIGPKKSGIYAHVKCVEGLEREIRRRKHLDLVSAELERRGLHADS